MGGVNQDIKDKDFKKTINLLVAKFIILYNLKNNNKFVVVKLPQINVKIYI